MAGQQWIATLRSYAARELKSRFDLAAFHDELLRNGPMPPDALEGHMRDWVAEQKTKR